jgi:hypothetical protein
MNHLLISDLARAEVSERIAAAGRDRLAHRATKRARRPEGRLRRTVHGIRASLSTWRARTQLGALVVPMSVEDCADASAR